MLYAGETPTAIEFRSSMPIELLGKDGVMKRVSSGHDSKEEPTEPLSMMTKFPTPE